MKNKKRLLIYFFCLLVSFIILLFTSKNSFIYQFNDWFDANAFFTVGKGMMNGIIPYRDVFEQKGILLYLIYGIGYLFSNTTFHGVFILEVISFSFFLYYGYKTIKLYLDEKYSIIILPLLAVLICTSRAFVHGGSAEEFSLLFMMITIYYFFKFIKQKEIDYHDLLICGITCGCVFLIKYTLLGFWFAFILCIFISLLRKKEFNNAIMSCLAFLCGMLIPIIIALIYFNITDSLKAFINNYFIVNMSAYPDSGQNIFETLSSLFTGFIGSLASNGIIIFILICLLPLFISKLKINKKYKISIIILMVFTILGIFIGLKFYRYYILPIFIFVFISLIGICIYYKKYIDKFLNSKYKYLLIIYLLGLFALNYYGANYKEMIGYTKDDYVLYKYSEYINTYENPTLVNMGFLDTGLYTISNINTSTYYFEKQNLSYDKYPYNEDEFFDYIQTQKTDFILYVATKSLNQDDEIYKYYDLIYDDIQHIEQTDYTLYLFQKKTI